jgi:hypothetical protein
MRFLRSSLLQGLPGVLGVATLLGLLDLPQLRVVKSMDAESAIKREVFDGLGQD